MAVSRVGISGVMVASSLERPLKEFCVIESCQKLETLIPIISGVLEVFTHDPKP